MWYFALVMIVLCLYAYFRLANSSPQPPKRVIGPDDDPEFLRSLRSPH